MSTERLMKIQSQSEAVSLKLMIDKKEKRILYGEADKKFIDFLFTILSLPIGTILKIISAPDLAATGTTPSIIPMIGSLPSLYRSVETLNIDYFERSINKNNLISPTLPPNTQYQLHKLLRIDSSSSTPTLNNLYSNVSCSNAYCRCGYVGSTYGETCIVCRNSLPYIGGCGGDHGYVKGGMVKYMVLDDLTIKPVSSSMCTISLLTQLNVEDVRQIEEKIVPFHLNNEGVKLLRASLHSNNVLTDVFCSILLDLSTKPDTTATTKRKRSGTLF